MVGDVLFLGFSVDNEAGSFGESIEFATGLFHSAEIRDIRGGRGRERDRGCFPQGKRVKGVR